MDNTVDKARKIIRENRYMTLATCSEGSPWIAPLAYVVDANYNFYWYSAIDVRHSQHIKRNPHAAVAIYNSTEPSDIADGLQMSGTASEVSESDLARVMDLYWKQSFPDEQVRSQWMRPAKDFTGNAIQRFYQFTPTQIYKPDPSDIKVDRRMEINLEELRRQPVHA